MKPLSLLLTLVFFLSSSIAAEKITHSFLGVGKANKAVIVGEDNEILWQFDQPASDGWVLPNGNILLALYPTRQFPGGGVMEVERETKKIVFEYKATQKEVSTAIKRANGHTIIGCTHGNRVIETGPDGKIVWSVTNDDLGSELLADVCGVQRLPNGNSVLTSYRAKGKGKPKLIEVNRDKEIVWTYDGMPSGFHHFQILTTNGAALADSTLR